MNVDSFTQTLQTGFRVTLGATATLIETLQDPQKRADSWSKLSTEWGELSEAWAAKGEVTEQEARSLVESMMAQIGDQVSTVGESTMPTADPAPKTINTTATAVTDPAIQSDLQELTTQIAAMRAELDRLKQEGDA